MFISASCKQPELAATTTVCFATWRPTASGMASESMIHLRPREGTMFEDRRDEVLTQPDGQDALAFLLSLVSSDSSFLKLRNVRRVTIRIWSAPENEAKIRWVAQQVKRILSRPRFNALHRP